MPMHSRWFMPAFALFLGVAMSITAFPVLARILTDQRMTKTRIGTLALTCAAIDDVTAWCLLVVVIGVASIWSYSFWNFSLKNMLNVESRIAPFMAAAASIPGATNSA